MKEIEVRPGNRTLVHHIVLFARPKGSKVVSDARPGIPFVPKRDEKSRKEHPAQSDLGFLYAINTQSYEMVAVYVPGGIAFRTLPGQARLIPAGADLIFQMHYTANGKAGTDRSKVGSRFAAGPPRERVVNAFLLNDTLRIPPASRTTAWTPR